MLSVFTCITDQHDLKLVVVAALICAIASFAAFEFHGRCRRARGGLQRGWLVMTSLAAGGGVWATHFTAMLAYDPGLRIAYEPWATGASLLISVLGCALGFTLLGFVRRPWAPAVGGALAGLTIAAMHFVGVTAIRTAGDVHFHVPDVLAALGVGAAGAAAAFQASATIEGVKGRLAAGALLVVGITGLHFTAMSAVTITPNPALYIPAENIGRNVLAAATAGLAAVLIAAGAALAFTEQLGRRLVLGGLHHALDALSAGLAFFDAQERLIGCNDAYAALLASANVEATPGRTRQEIFAELRAVGWFALVPQEARGVHAEIGAGRNVEMEMHLPDGRALLAEAFPTTGGGSVTVLQDVTGRIQAARDLAAARDSAEAASRAKSAFLANMSHEIRTPLNGVLGIADVLAQTELTEQQAKLVGVIQSSGALLNALLTDLLDLARVEAGVAERTQETADLAALLRSVGDLFNARAEQKGLALGVRTSPDLGWAECDATRLRQVMGNLVNNAVKFTETGAVTISAERRGERVRFCVRDTGMGFDATLKAKLFGRFQQADDTSTRKYGGAGLGLAICREYVGLMGGELDCHSRPGEGSSFYFELALPAAAAPAVESAPAEGGPAGRFRALIVDDNAVNRQVLGLILDSLGVDHSEAEDGLQGLEAVTTGGFDLVLMDIQMPVMDGFESIRRIRSWEQAEGRGRMPIFVVSANCLQEHVDAGVAAGSDGHLNKPVSAAQLVAAIEPHFRAAMGEVAEAA